MDEAQQINKGLSQQCNLTIAEQTRSATPAKPGIFVRVTSDQYVRIAADAEVLGKSLPQTLREAYFEGPPLAPLVSKKDLKPIIGALGRIGNNLNQIARRLNTGGKADEPEAAVVRGIEEELTALRNFLTGKYVRRGHAGG